MGGEGESKRRRDTRKDVSEIVYRGERTSFLLIVAFNF